MTKARCGIASCGETEGRWCDDQRRQTCSFGDPRFRARLKRGRQPHWQSLVPGKEHLGYQRWPGEPDGRWIWRHRLGSATKGGRHYFSRYATTTLGLADDTSQADGSAVLSYAQAMAAARAAIASPRGQIHGLTVRQAMDRYVQFKLAQGQSVADLLSRARAHVLPVLGDFAVEALTAELLRNWLARLAATPAQVRPKANKPQYRPAPKTDEDIRRRRASANRVLTMLKACLNSRLRRRAHVQSRRLGPQAQTVP